MKIRTALCKSFSYVLNVLLICFLFVSLTYGGAFNGKFGMGVLGGKDYLVMLYSGDHMVNFWVVKNGKIERNPQSNTTIWEVNGNTYTASGTLLVVQLNHKTMDYNAMKKKYHLKDSDVSRIQNILRY